ncbi:TPA: DUF4238 domain-containing protein [Aeromonas hydrophila]
MKYYPTVFCPTYGKLANSGNIKMKEKQNQHYVPQYYFRKFSDDDISIRMLLKKSGKIIENVAISNQASKNNFYGDRDTENKVTKFDNKFSAIISKAVKEIENKKLTADSFFGLMEAVCFQSLRTLSYREEQKPLMKFYEEFFKPQIESVDDYDSGISEEITKTINNVMRDALESMSDGQKWQSFEMFNVEKEYDKIADLDAVFLSNLTPYPFFFGDTPVSRFNISLQNLRCSQRGNMHHGIIIYYPISSTLGFLMYDRSAYRLLSDNLNIVYLSEKEDIDNLNRLQIHHATNSIYFKEMSDHDYVKSLWHNEKESFSYIPSKIELCEEITIDGYLTGRKISTLVESEINLRIQLSFLEVENLSKFPCIPIRERFVSRDNLPEKYKHRIDICIDQRDTQHNI